MTIDKAQLKTLAEAVKQGHWVQDGFDVQDDGVEEYRVANCRSPAEAEFIAAVSPATILALLAEIDQLKLALDMESAELAWSDSDGREQGAENAKLKTELAGLRTGYDAQNNVIEDYKSGQDRYEQIIEEMKAENKVLAKALSECIQSLSEEMLSKYHEAPEDMHPSTKRRYDLEMEELAGYRAAMAKEEAHG